MRREVEHEELLKLLLITKEGLLAMIQDARERHEYYKISYYKHVLEKIETYQLCANVTFYNLGNERMK